MRKKSLIIMAVFGIAVLFAATGIYAGTAVQDVIKMENKAYAEHKKSIVMFSHKKHIEDYKAGCGECHHDENGKPLNNLKIGDNVQNCIECHKKPSERPKGKDAPKL
ncbi:MAG: cytochrome c3 family protein, partial [Desulfobacteraceae bacterium]|nr:cytochrome c3 family protein [Desulfobacteraceae bacterium]